ncbi:hypothetical protein AB0C11_43775 [Streptomyces sp. NPDC039016]|uniref:hypothetical protein n=1 Tax=Streptomyces sp. NPDC039016 TaxID=3154330 RepID=UPI0033CBEC39
MNGKLARTTLAAVVATLLAGVALAAPASAATAAPGRGAVTADSATYYVYATGVSGAPSSGVRPEHRGKDVQGWAKVGPARQGRRGA